MHSLFDGPLLKKAALQFTRRGNADPTGLMYSS